MNSDAFQWMMIFIFGFLAIYMGYLMLQTRGKVQIKDQRWTMIRWLVLLIGLLSITEVVTQYSPLVLLRVIVTMIACFVFFFSHDGLGQEGIVSGSYFYAYKNIRAYDVFEDGKKVTALFVVNEEGRKRKHEELNREVVFDQKNKEAVESLLKEKIGKKYRRMRRT